MGLALKTSLSTLAIIALVPVAGAALEARVSLDGQFRASVLQDIRNAYNGQPNQRLLRYSIALVDLNGDGRNEALVYVWPCGTGGCGLNVYRNQSGQAELVSEMSIGWAPIRLLPRRSHGWLDIGLVQHGGGILKPYEARLRFDGKRYPYNPTVRPAIAQSLGSPGRVVIKDVSLPLF